MSDSTQSILHVLCRLWRLLPAKRRRYVGWLLLLMSGAAFAEVVSIGSVLPLLGVLVAPERAFEHRYAQGLIDAWNIQKASDLLLPITLIFCAATFLAVGLRLTLVWAQIRFSATMATEFSLMTYWRILHQPYVFHVAHNSSEVLVGVAKAGELGAMLVLPGLTLVSNTILLAMILSALMAIDPYVALSAFVGFAVIYVFIAMLTKKRLSADSQRINIESQGMMQALQEGLGGIRDVLIDGTQKTFADIFRDASVSFRYSVASVSMVSQSPRYLVEALGMWLIAAIAYFLAASDGGLQRAIPVLGALAMGAQRMLPALQQLYTSLITIRGGRDSATAALDLIERPMPLIKTTTVETQPFREKITLRDLSFRYALGGPWVLKSVNLDIPRGVKMGFIGTTGSGKSTLLDVIMGLLPPSQGDVLVDGQAITSENLSAWQAHVAHVPQAIYLSDASIAENIAFGIPKDKIDYERVKKAARDASIADSIECWSRKYETIVGERGVRLSGGQRQRIGIARALYKQADVIVFDEATSALDSETEFEVMQTIESLGGGVTVLIIAHRLSTLQMCSRIVELAGGKVQRIGSYAEIIKIA